MRSSLFASAALALSASFVAAAPVEQRADSSKVGYLISSFLGNVPSVYQYLSNGNDALSFRALNGGNPILNPTVGTKGARDPYLANKDGKYYMLATDLDISKTNFGEAQRVGSRSIIIWESDDLVNWSSDRLAQLETAEAGYVWAPSAYCEPGSNECIVFWSSRFYASSDTNHTGDVVKASTIRYSRTSDFVNFSEPADYIPTQPWGMIDQEFQKLENGGFARFIKNNTANNVWWETTNDNNILSSSWTYHGLVTSDVREGPASYADNKQSGLYHLLLDNYSGQGSYEVYGTTDIYNGPWTKPSAPNFPYGQRHGSVLPLTQDQYDAISSKYPASS